MWGEWVAHDSAAGSPAAIVKKGDSREITRISLLARSSTNHPELPGTHDGLGTALHAELTEQVRNVRLDGIG